MDNFPEHLKPRFEPGGAVEEPFEEWWPKVREHFPNVPEDAARYWLHEHWNHSPYRYLISKAYEFTRAEWPAERLFEVRSTWDDYSEGNRQRSRTPDPIASFTSAMKAATLGSLSLLITAHFAALRMAYSGRSSR
jgi:hypothetical protein